MGQKSPLKLKEIWAIRIRLQLSHNLRELALFNLAIDSKLRGCDLVKLKVSDVTQGGSISHRATITQQKTNQPVQFELTGQTREALLDWITKASLKHSEFLFPSKARLRHQFLVSFPRLKDHEIHTINGLRFHPGYQKTNNLLAI